MADDPVDGSRCACRGCAKASLPIQIINKCMYCSRYLHPVSDGCSEAVDVEGEGKIQCRSSDSQVCVDFNRVIREMYQADVPLRVPLRDDLSTVVPVGRESEETADSDRDNEPPQSPDESTFNAIATETPRRSPRLAATSSSGRNPDSNRTWWRRGDVEEGDAVTT